MLDMHKLKAFVAVVEEANISRAAQRLHMQQPPLTRLIKNLESELNATLLKRLPRGVEVTDAGKILYEEALSILAHAQAIAQRVSQISQGIEGQIRIGFTNSVGLHPFLPAVLRQFRVQASAVSIHLEEEGSSALYQALISQRLDVIFVRKPAPMHSALKSLHVLDEALIVALPTNHVLVDAPEPIALTALEMHDFVSYRRLSGQDLFDNILSTCYQAGFSPRIVQETPRLTSSLNLVAAGIGLSIVPDAMRDFWSSQIVYKQLTADTPCRASIYAIYHADSDNPCLAHFLSCLNAQSDQDLYG